MPARGWWEGVKEEHPKILPNTFWVFIESQEMTGNHLALEAKEMNQVEKFIFQLPIVTMQAFGSWEHVKVVVLSLQFVLWQ